MRRAHHANYKVFAAFEGYLPGWKGMLGLLLWLLVGAVAGAVVSAILGHILGSGLGQEYVLLVSYPIQFIPAMIYAASRSAAITTFPGAKVLALDRNRFSSPSGLLCALLSVLVVCAASFVCDPLTAVLPEMPESLKASLESMTGGDLWVDLLCVAVFAPFFEEWLCRGMVLRGLLGRGMKPVWAIAASAAFFALIHFNPWQAIPAFLVGCLMGFVYYRTGSLKLTMLMHCVNNASAVILSHTESLKDFESWMDVIPGRWFWLIFAASVLVIVLVVKAMLRTELPGWTAECVEEK